MMALQSVLPLAFSMGHRYSVLPLASSMELPMAFLMNHRLVFPMELPTDNSYNLRYNNHLEMMDKSDSNASYTPLGLGILFPESFQLGLGCPKIHGIGVHNPPALNERLGRLY